MVGTDGDCQDVVEIGGNVWGAQSFGVASSYHLDDVRLLMRHESGPRTILVMLLHGDTSGPEIARGAGQVLSSASPAWVVVPMGVDVEPGTYTIVVTSTGTIVWRIQGGSGFHKSTDAGHTWGDG